MAFKKGQSGNPGGVPKGGKALAPATIEEVLDLAKTFSIEALQVLRTIMRDKKNSPTARVVAAKGLLERAWGAPVSYNAEEDRNRRELDSITDEELLADINRLRRTRAGGRAVPSPADPKIAH